MMTNQTDPDRNEKNREDSGEETTNVTGEKTAPGADARLGESGREKPTPPSTAADVESDSTVTGPEHDHHARSEGYAERRGSESGKNHLHDSKEG